MGTIWYAIGIYMIGIAVVLYIRPKSMFQENGMWKEFGLSAHQQTVFPFWMFALVWAILSYALANLVAMFFASVALRSSDAPINHSFLQPISTHPNVQPLPAAMPAAMPMPTMPAMPAMPTKAPGYYILDPYANPAQPRYLYYGTEPPGFTPAAM